MNKKFLRKFQYFLNIEIIKIIFYSSNLLGWFASSIMAYLLYLHPTWDLCSLHPYILDLVICWHSFSLIVTVLSSRVESVLNQSPPNTSFPPKCCLRMWANPYPHCTTVLRTCMVFLYSSVVQEVGFPESKARETSLKPYKKIY